MPDASATPANTPIPPGRRLSGLTAAAASAAASAAGGTAASRKSGGSGGSSGSRSSGSRSGASPSGSSSSSRPPSPLTPGSTTAPDADTAAAAPRGMRTSTSTETAATTSSDDESTSPSGGTVQRPGGISRKYVSTLVRRRSMSAEADGMMALAVPTTTGAKDMGKEERIAEVPSSEDVLGVGVSRPLSSTPAPTRREGDDAVPITTSSSSAESVYHSFPSLVPNDTAALAAAVLARSGACTPTQQISIPTTLSLPPPPPPTIPTMTVIPPPLSTTTTTSSAPRKPKSILRTPPGSKDPMTSGPPVIARTRDIAKIKAVMFRAQLVDVREISRMSLSTDVSGTSSTHQLDQNTAAMVSSLFLDIGGNTSIVVPAAPAPAAPASASASPESVGLPRMPSSFSASDLAELMLLSDSLGWTPPGSTGRGSTAGSSIPSTPPTLSRNLRKRPPTAPRPRRESPMASTAGLPPPPGLVGNFDPLDGIPAYGSAIPAPDMLGSPPDDLATGDPAAPGGVTAVTTTTDLLPPPGVLVMPLDPNATNTTLSQSGHLPLIAPHSLWSWLILRVRAPLPPSPPGKGSATAGPPLRQSQQADAATRRRAASEVTGRAAVTAFLAKARRDSGSNSGGGGGTAASGEAETVVVMRPSGERP